ncbi:peroxiredoxin [Ferruginibacter profundus]
MLLTIFAPLSLQKQNTFTIMAIEIGQAAPDFTLHDTDKKEVTLSEQKGKNVLLLFFPLAFTGVCTKELCAIRDDIAKYNNANATVFGISVDSFATLKKFKEEQGYNFSLLSDFNKEVSSAYGCLYDAFIGWMKGVSKRSAFIIDKEGIIQYAQVLESAGDLPDFEAINAKLEQLNS